MTKNDDDNTNADVNVKADVAMPRTYIVIRNSKFAINLCLLNIKPVKQRSVSTLNLKRLNF